MGAAHLLLPAIQANLVEVPGKVDATLRFFSADNVETGAIDRQAMWVFEAFASHMKIHYLLLRHACDGARRNFCEPRELTNSIV